MNLLNNEIEACTCTGVKIEIKRNAKKIKENLTKKKKTLIELKPTDFF